MNYKIIDISVPIKKDMPSWPNTPGVHFEQTSSLEKGDLSNETTINLSVHTGTHLDSPLHFVADGLSIDKIPLENLIGSIFVADLGQVKTITPEDLENLHLPQDVVRLLLKTANSDLWVKGEKEFQKDFVGLNPAAAAWLVERGIKLIGIDYLSIAQFDKTDEVHQVLLKNGVMVLEGLNLAEVKSGFYKLICLPIKLIGSEAALARAVLIEK